MAKKRLDSKRTSKKIFVSKTGIEIIEKLCRKCLVSKKPNKFYNATDYYLDTDGLQSVCKDCYNEIYENSYLRQRTINKAILESCRILNLRYHAPAVESVLEQIKKAEGDGKKARPPLSTYTQRMVVMLSRGQGIEDPANYELTFFEPTSPLMTTEDEELMSHDKFWGENIPFLDVEFLEGEYQKFREGFSSESYTETVLLKRVCYKLLEIKKAQDSDGKGGLGKLEKELLVLFKEMAISPAHASASSSGAMKDAFGVWIEEIEKYSPAEWLEQENRSMFRDVDNAELYFQNYIVRPIKNFFIGTPDYALVDEDGEDDEQL